MLKITNSTFNQNNVSFYGGAIYVSGINVQFYNNLLVNF